LHAHNRIQNDREHGGRVGLGDTFSYGGVAREWMSVTSARKQRVEKAIVLAGAGAKPGSAKHVVQVRLGRRVPLEVVHLPARPGRRWELHSQRDTRTPGQGSRSSGFVRFNHISVPEKGGT